MKVGVRDAPDVCTDHLRQRRIRLGKNRRRRRGLLGHDVSNPARGRFRGRAREQVEVRLSLARGLKVIGVAPQEEREDSIASTPIRRGRGARVACEQDANALQPTSPSARLWFRDVLKGMLKHWPNGCALAAGRSDSPARADNSSGPPWGTRCRAARSGRYRTRSSSWSISSSVTVITRLDAV